jgi:hypothetical protein
MSAFEAYEKNLENAPDKTWHGNRRAGFDNDESTLIFAMSEMSYFMANRGDWKAPDQECASVALGCILAFGSTKTATEHDILQFVLALREMLGNRLNTRTMQTKLTKNMVVPVMPLLNESVRANIVDYTALNLVVSGFKLLPGVDKRFEAFNSAYAGTNPNVPVVDYSAAFGRVGVSARELLARRYPLNSSTANAAKISSSPIDLNLASTKIGPLLPFLALPVDKTSADTLDAVEMCALAILVYLFNDAGNGGNYLTSGNAFGPLCWMPYVVITRSGRMDWGAAEACYLSTVFSEESQKRFLEDDVKRFFDKVRTWKIGRLRFAVADSYVLERSLGGRSIEEVRKSYPEMTVGVPTEFKKSVSATEYETTIAQLTSEVASLQKQIEEAFRDRPGETGEKKRVSRFATMESLNEKNLREENTILKDRVKNFETYHEEDRDKIDRLKFDLDYAQKALETMRRDALQNEKQLHNDLKRLELDLEAKIREVETRQKSESAKDASLQSANASIQILQGSITSKEGELQTKDAELARVNQALQAATASAAGAAGPTDPGYTTALANLQAESAKASAVAAAAAAEKTKFETENKTLEQTKIILNAEADKLVKEQNALGNEQAANKQLAANLKLERQTLEAEKQNLDAQKANQQVAVAAAVQAGVAAAVAATPKNSAPITTLGDFGIGFDGKKFTVQDNGLFVKSCQQNERELARVFRAAASGPNSTKARTFVRRTPRLAQIVGPIG